MILKSWWRDCTVWDFVFLCHLIRNSYVPWLDSRHCVRLLGNVHRGGWWLWPWSDGLHFLGRMKMRHHRSYGNVCNICRWFLVARIMWTRYRLYAQPCRFNCCRLLINVSHSFIFLRFHLPSFLYFWLRDQPKHAFLRYLCYMTICLNDGDGQKEYWQWW